MNINPRPISGGWDDGFSLDDHIVRSEFTEYDEYGHPQFHTIRTELGELLFKLKYKNDRSAIPFIAQAACDFIQQWNPGIDVIVPTPPSKKRAIQPLYEIAKELGTLLHCPVDTHSVTKIKETEELKNVVEYAKRLDLIDGAYVIQSSALHGKRILLLDDLYQSGATLNAVSRLLKSKNTASSVFVLALTRTRSSS